MDYPEKVISPWMEPKVSGMGIFLSRCDIERK